MLNKEKLSEIVKEAIGTQSYVCKVEQGSSQNSCTIRLYYGYGKLDDAGLVATIYLSEGKALGSFHASFVPGITSKIDREVLRMINNKLFDYFVKKLEPKYYIKLLNDDYGYLTYIEYSELWDLTSLLIAKTYNQKVAFTADEINEMIMDEVFPNVDLWGAAKEVEEDEQ